MDWLKCSRGTVSFMAGLTGTQAMPGTSGGNTESTAQIRCPFGRERTGAAIITGAYFEGGQRQRYGGMICFNNESDRLTNGRK